MNRKLNPNAIPFTPQSTLTSTKHPHEWPPISRTDDPDEHETLEEIKRLSKWIDEWESSTNPNNQHKKSTNFTLQKPFPITEIYQHRQKLESRIKQLSNSAEEEKTKRLQLETVISDLRATIKCQASLLGKVNTIDHRSSDPCLWQIAAFSTLYRKARTSPDDPLHHMKYSFTSPIYNTHLTGYKISFRIFPYGVFRGTHISICCELHLNDFTLPRTWPFDSQIEIALLDQKNKDNKWSASFPFTCNMNEHGSTHNNDYTLPGLLREDFIAHTKLLANFREAFLNDDSVIIQIKFEKLLPQIPSAKPFSHPF